MPRYDYQCDTCHHQFERALPMSQNSLPESEPCPNCSATETVKQIITAAGIVDPVTLGVSRPPSEFMTDVLGRIHKRVPESNMFRNSRFVPSR